jgi:hypothetical protein
VLSYTCSVIYSTIHERLGFKNEQEETNNESLDALLDAIQSDVGTIADNEPIKDDEIEH